MIRSALFLCLLLPVGLTTLAQRAGNDPTNYETMKKYLSLRIYPRETIETHGGTDSLVVRTDLEGTYTLLMLDFPGGFTPVRRNMFDHWKKDAAEVFQAAQANVDSVKVQRATKTFDLNEVKMDVTMLGEENYAASYALDLEHNAPDLVGEWGCAVAMPYKGLVCLCKMNRGDRIDFAKFIRLTQPFIEKAYQEHPQPVSDQYFWYYKGKFTRIETSVVNGAHHIVAPPGLAELISQTP